MQDILNLVQLILLLNLLLLSEAQILELWELLKKLDSGLILGKLMFIKKTNVKHGVDTSLLLLLEITLSESQLMTELLSIFRQYTDQLNLQLLLFLRQTFTNT